jgi:hypothetical protein
MWQRRECPDHSEGQLPTLKQSIFTTFQISFCYLNPDAGELQLLRLSVSGLGIKRAISEAAIFEGLSSTKCLLCVAPACGTSSGYPVRCVPSSESDDTLHTRLRLRPLPMMPNRTIRSVYESWSGIYFGRSVRNLRRKCSKRRT